MLAISGQEWDRNAVSTAFCELPFRKVILNAHGFVSTCCHQRKQIGKLGPETSVLSLWRSAMAEEIRTQTLKGELAAACRSGKSCPFLHSAQTPSQFRAHRTFDVPRHLEICLPDSHCNIGGLNPSEDNPACLMCKRNFGLPRGQVPVEFLYGKSRPLVEHLEELTLLGVAEPFWKDAVFECFEAIGFPPHRSKIKFSTNTNGTCLNERTMRRFYSETDRSSLSFSIDAATRETFKKIRRLDVFDLVRRNLEQSVSLRAEYGGAEAREIVVYNNLNTLNVREAPEMVRQAAAAGADRMILVPTYEQGGAVNLGPLLLNASNVGLFSSCVTEARGEAARLGLRLVTPVRFDVPLSSWHSVPETGPQTVQLTVGTGSV